MKTTSTTTQVQGGTLGYSRTELQKRAQQLKERVGEYRSTLQIRRDTSIGTIKRAPSKTK
jgi:hypothetical protein